MSVAILTVSLALLIPQLPERAGVLNSGRIAGRVVDAESGAPIAGVVVMVMPVVQRVGPAVMGPPQSLTDANGEFAFEYIGVGRWRIQAQKTGFAPLSDDSDAYSFDLAAGQALTGLTLALRKGSVIAGRVLDARGEPLTDIAVTALRLTTAPNGGFGKTMQMSATNDLGEFRLPGLPEGRYVVIGTPVPRPLEPQSSPAAGTVLTPTFYPGTPDRDAAHIIDLGPAQTVTDIQFSIVAAPAHQVSGVVVDEAGLPQVGATVTLIGVRTGGPLPPAVGHTDQSGAFTIGGVVSGTYRVTAVIPVRVPGGGDSRAIGAVIGGFVSVTGGVAAGGAAAVAPGVGFAAWSSDDVPQGAVEVIVENADVTGVRILVPAQQR
jgi:hypothetical protein